MQVCDVFSNHNFTLLLVFIIYYFTTGPVKYDATLFVKKNMDSIPKDLLDCAAECSNDLISTELLAAAAAREAGGSSGSAKARKVGMTITTKFRTQLNSLMSSVETTRTRYIRCIKSNEAKKPGVINISSALQQLRCAGVVAAVSISRAAFPNRLSHDIALNRFNCLRESTTKKVENVEDEDNIGNEVDLFMSEQLKSMEQEENGSARKAFVCGKSRVYFYAGALEYLESKRLVALGLHATLMQRVIRKFVARSKFLTMKSAAVKCQAFTRFAVTRNKHVRLRRAAICVECWTRVHQAKAKLYFKRKMKACTIIQYSWRRARDMSMLKRCISSVINIQRIVRGSIQRPIYREMLAQAKEDAKIENQLKILQRKLAAAEKSRKEEQQRRIEAESRIAAGGSTVITELSPSNEEKKVEDDALIHESNE